MERAVHSLKSKKGVNASITRTDIAAVICFTGLACYFFFAVRYGIGVIDESFYLTIPHRLLFGDSLLTDEWHLSQLSSFFQLLPVKLFVTLTGGTDGIILFMRYFFVVCWLTVAVIVYITLRRYGTAALAGTVFFAFTVPVDIPAVNYYSGLVMSAALLCCVLFWREKKEIGPAGFILSGILLSCMVLNDPLDAVLYFIYSAAVLIGLIVHRRKKNTAEKYGYFINIRSWLFITAGILISMAAVFAFILSRTDVNTVIKTLPELFTDSEYSFASDGSLASANTRNVFSMNLLASAVRAMGTARVLLFSALCAAGLFFRKRNKTVTVLLLFCASILSVVMSVSFFGSDPVGVRQIDCINIPTVLCGVMLLSFTENHDGRLTLSAVILFLVSAIRDISSEITLGIAACALIPVFAVYAAKLAGELLHGRTDDNADVSGKKPSAEKVLRAVCTAAAAAAVLVTVSVSAASSARMPLLYEKTFFYFSSDTSREVLDRGPLKGIHTFGKLAGTYDLILDDLDEIRQNRSQEVYVANLNSWYYLYLDKPYGTYSTWYVEEDSETRQLRYWELYPDKRPEFIYIPKIDRNTFRANNAAAEEKLRFIRSVCDCESAESLVGITVRVLSWK